MRFDDVRLGVATELRDPVDVWTATDVADVRAVVRAADAAARGGRWVAGFLTYEAGAAFDGSFPARPCAGTLPLAWFAAFERCAPAAPIETLPLRAAAVRNLRRDPGSEWFRAAVERVREEIAEGNVYQVNISDHFVGELDGGPFDLYVAMASAQRGAFHAFVDLGDAAIVSASPEQFLVWDGDLLACKPMKGTARRAVRPEHDECAGRDLAASEKDRAENVMIVDLVRNDLGRIAANGGVRVPALFDVERYETVWQMTSTVTAVARPGLDLDAVLSATFPCGSVTGAPKTAAMRLIDTLEPRPRGIHTGTIGLLAPPGQGPRARLSVAIRTAVVDRASGTVDYGAGAGITWSSHPAAEDREVDAKVEVLRAGWPRFCLLETMLLDREGPRHLDRHLARLASSAGWFGFPFDREGIARRIADLGKPAEPHRLRVVLACDGVAELQAVPLDVAPAVVQLAVADRAVRSDDVFCAHKTTHRVVYDTARAAHPGADDVVLVNERGEAVETTVANLLFREGGQWWTPPLSSGGLAGVGRAALLAEGRVRERVILAADLAACDELAVVSSMRGVRPATLVTGC